MVNWEKWKGFLNMFLYVHLKQWTQNFEQPFIYKIICWITSVRTKNNTYLTHSKTLRKKVIPHVVFLRMHFNEQE